VKDEYFKADECARKHDTIVESRNGIGPQGGLVVVWLRNGPVDFAYFIRFIDGLWASRLGVGMCRSLSFQAGMGGKKVNAMSATGCGGPCGWETSRLQHFLDSRLTAVM
jgi:hypothetical protein